MPPVVVSLEGSAPGPAVPSREATTLGDVTPRVPKPTPLIGWREWVAFPELGIDAIKAKIDTGARTSSLHASRITPFLQDGEQWVRFEVHPFQRDTKRTVTASAPLLGQRSIRSTSGHDMLRPVIVTDLELAGERRSIELTLSNRDTMGFRLLLGRRALRRFHVQPGRSYLTGRREETR